MSSNSVSPTREYWQVPLTEIVYDFLARACHEFSDSATNTLKVAAWLLKVTKTPSCILSSDGKTLRVFFPFFPGQTKPRAPLSNEDAERLGGFTFSAVVVARMPDGKIYEFGDIPVEIPKNAWNNIL